MEHIENILIMLIYTYIYCNVDLENDEFITPDNSQ